LSFLFAEQTPVDEGGQLRRQLSELRADAVCLCGRDRSAGGVEREEQIQRVVREQRSQPVLKSVHLAIPALFVRVGGADLGAPRIPQAERRVGRIFPLRGRPEW
jgi:hypothetical protein